MLRKLQTLKNKQQGFTIIEVLIVLAIAALILVIVLIAIPQLQRNQRNTARKAILGRIVTEVGEFSGNNNGKIPIGTTASGVDNFATPAAAAGFFARYMGCTTTGTDTTCTTNITDPGTGDPMTVAFAQNSTPTDTQYPTAEGQIGYYQGQQCSGENVIDGQDRDYALVVWLEGGARSCQPAE